ncbi:ABC transporter permease [Cochlodiniinecator piscidefendens]|uniref:ABC transporter permease n=1 Tax=Cochlodiniinecator piscidefendens TaxID=2715756 RepID=UPI00140DF2FB|nr:ABC transporter permease [Cochlodiniinecator piscidefendens]
MSLWEIVRHRLVLGVGTLLFVSVLVFVGTEILPGDVAHAILGQNATPELLDQVRERLGLNEPLHVRYFVWLTNFVSGDFGASLANGADIGTEVGRRASNTLLLALSTAVIAVPLAIALGLAAAVKPGGLVDRAITSTSLMLISFPDFLVAVVLVTIFAIKLRWLPAIASIRPSYDVFDWIRVLILPVTALTFTILAHMVRMTRSAVLNVLSSPAIEMAILKGVPRRRLLLRHALPNALGPIVNVVALNLAYLISGVVVIETLFNFPGLGRYMVEAVTNRDVPIVQTCAMIFCSFYVLLNMTADILSIMANPRVRYKK